MTSPIVALPPNLLGRDFVAGPVRGRFTRLEAALRAQGYRPGTDRLLLMGDLLSPAGEDVIARAWLSRPGVYAVRGPAEQSVIELARAARQGTSGAPTRLSLGPAARWVREACPERIAAWTRALIALPVLLEVRRARGDRVGLVHGEVPPGISWDDALAQAHEPAVLHSLVCGRRRVAAAHRHGHGVPTHVAHVAGLVACITAAPASFGTIRGVDSSATVTVVEVDALVDQCATSRDPRHLVIADPSARTG
jgi:serine/threonine protein phosphatase 1